MFDELLKVGGAKFLVPCVVAAILVALLKGLFGVHQSKRAIRKEFLDLWILKNERDELWQQTAIRHLFGEWLPMPIIQRLMKSSQSGRALAEISLTWDLLQIDDETFEVSWKVRRHRKPSGRQREIRLFSTLYFLLGVPAILIALYACYSSQGGLASVVQWALAIELAIFALVCLNHAENLKVADVAVPRWLGIA